MGRMALVDYDSSDESGEDSAIASTAGVSVGALQRICMCNKAPLKFLPTRGDWPCLVFCRGEVSSCPHVVTAQADVDGCFSKMQFLLSTCLGLSSSFKTYHGLQDWIS